MILEGYERDLAEALRQAGVFADVAPEMLDLSKGVIAVCCCDGDQIWDRITFLGGMTRTTCASERIHLHTRHGGACRIPRDSPLNASASTMSDDLMQEIGEATKLKKIDQVLLEAHFLCGKLKAANVGIHEALQLLIQAKKRVRQEIPGIKVAAIVHVAWSESKKNYYHFSRNRYVEFLETAGRDTMLQRYSAPISPTLRAANA